MPTPQTAQIPRQRFAERVRDRRLELGWTVSELARRAQIDRAYLGTVEAGRNNISIANADKVAAALGLSLDRMLAEEGPR